jgi:nucleoside-diphosphate-sugar epimerase
MFPAPMKYMPITLDPEIDQTGAFDGVDALVHAAFSHVPGRYRGGEGDDPQGFRRLNLEGSARLFRTAKRAGVARCIFLSSRAVYGDTGNGAMSFEGMEPEPATLYGEVKIEAERALFASGDTEFTTVSLRPTGIYGDLRPNKWDRLIDNYLAGRPVSGCAGTEVHGRDVARAVSLLLEADPRFVAGHAFNLSDIRTDTHEILEIVQQVTRSPHPLPEASAHAITGEMDTSRIRALGWTGGGKALFEETIRNLCKTLQPAPDLGGWSGI